MGKKKSNSTQEWAKAMYINENRTQLEIAEACGVTRQTVARWIKQGKWEEHKASITMSRSEIIKNLQMQIMDINKAIADRPEMERHASPPEIHAITQLTAAISKLETELGIHEIVNVAQDFIAFIRNLGDQEVIKKFVPLFDLYIKSKL